MEPKHIVISANTSWYLHNFRTNLIKRLIQENYRITAVAPYDAYSDKLTKIGCKHFNVYIDQGGTNPIKDLRTTVSFLKLYRHIKPDVVLNFTPKNNIYSTLASAILNIKSVNNIAGLGSIFIRDHPLAFIVRQLYKLSQQHTNWIFFQNLDDQLLFTRSNIAKRTPTELIPGSGVDLVRFKPTPLNTDGPIRFLLVARLLYEKGIVSYVEAAKFLRAKHPNTEFRLIGLIDNRNPSAIPLEIVNEWHESGDIRYLGSSDEIEKDLAQVDCIVLPSYYREGVPRSLLEGASMARPIITTENVGCRETVQHGVNGFLCEPKNTESLIAAMEKIILMSPEQRVSMGLRGREIMETRFDEKIVLDAYSKIVNKLTN